MSTGCYVTGRTEFLYRRGTGWFCAGCGAFVGDVTWTPAPIHPARPSRVVVGIEQQDTQ